MRARFLVYRWLSSRCDLAWQRAESSDTLKSVWGNKWAISCSSRRCTGGTVLGLNSHCSFTCVDWRLRTCALLLHRDASSLLDPMECTDTAEEQRVHSPPASLVPRIHVVLAHKLQHINPLLPACLNKEESKTCKCKCWSHRLVPRVSELPVTHVCARWDWVRRLLITVCAHCPLWEFSSLKWGRGEYLNCLISKIGTSYWPIDKSVLVVYRLVLFVPPVYFFNLRHLCWSWIWPPFFSSCFKFHVGIVSSPSRTAWVPHSCPFGR